jgi:tetratricopeptide (TPR) repeat protein/tRNA A-37 threonylcarbamoyl transferase component Bud32
MPQSQAYQIGDIIGQKYEVFGVVGKGGFGVVYMVYSHSTHSVYALKTFRDEYLDDPEARALFRKEAQVWVDLERHPYLVRAYFVDEISGRLYIAMEYIAPDESYPNTLQGYLVRRPPDLTQSLHWAIQFCHGMEYAYSKGVRCHRDIKPVNIMISQDKTVKITDFGLAGVLGASKAVSGIQLNIQEGKVGLSFRTLAGHGIGTPTHMPLEQFYDVGYCDQRSDIYSFGVVLFQMASEGKLPFFPAPPKDNSQAEHLRFWQEIQRLHEQALVPELSSPLFPIIQRCLEKMPEKRYQSFSELRNDLEPLLKQKSGEVIRIPDGKELEAWEWGNKGRSLDSLGNKNEAIRCYDKTLELDPRDARALCNKGGSLNDLGRYDEAIRCFDKALELDPQGASAWNNKGVSLGGLGRHNEAIRFYDKALELDPRNAVAWANKGGSLNDLGRHDDAIWCFEKAIELDPSNADAWCNKGGSLNDLGRYNDAIWCFEKAIELDPSNAGAWSNNGVSLDGLGRHNEAIRFYDKALGLDPRNAVAWGNKGGSLDDLGRNNEALGCYEKVIALNPRNVDAWTYKGVSFSKLGCYVEAFGCFEKAIELDPRNSNAWYVKALIEDALARNQDAVHSYKQFLALAPAQFAKQIANAHQRLEELEGKKR